MSKLSPESRALLRRFAADAQPDAARRERNFDRVQARLGEDPLADLPGSSRHLGLWVAVAVALLFAAALGLMARKIADQLDGPAPSLAGDVLDPAGTTGRDGATPLDRGLAVQLPEDDSSEARDPRKRPGEPALPASAAATGEPPTTPHSPDKVTTAPAGAAQSRGSQPPNPTASHATPSERERSRLELETRLVDQARRALAADDRARAVELLRRHAAEFPRGVMAEDRRAMSAMLTCRANAADSRPAAQSFLARHPNSPYVARVRQVCAHALGQK